MKSLLVSLLLLSSILVSFISASFAEPKFIIGGIPALPAAAILSSEQIFPCGTWEFVAYQRGYDTDGDLPGGLEILTYGSFQDGEYGPVRGRVDFGDGPGGLFTEGWVLVGGLVKHYVGLEGLDQLRRDFPNPCFFIFSRSFRDA